MALIKCNNTRNEKGQIEKCDRFLVDVPQCVVDALRRNPGERITMRCPACSLKDRWVQVYYGEDGLTWEALVDKPDFGDELVYDSVKNSLQLG
jgi:hypothetical protein